MRVFVSNFASYASYVVYFGKSCIFRIFFRITLANVCTNELPFANLADSRGFLVLENLVAISQDSKYTMNKISGLK